MYRLGRGSLRPRRKPNAPLRPTPATKPQSTARTTGQYAPRRASSPLGQKPVGSRPRPFDATHSTPKIRTLVGAAYVIDGDSLVIKGTQVRIFGVDAPEMNHPYGRNAKFAMMRLCKGQHVRAEIIAEDTHGRTVAKCFLPDGRDLSAELVKLGMALDWPKFSGGIYRELETPDARRKLWLADARQNGRMHVWEKYEAGKKSRAAKKA